MKTLDRVILGSLSVGIWVLSVTFYTHPKDAFAMSVDASDVDGLRHYIRRIVNGCSVDGTGYGSLSSTSIYMYDVEGGYGDVQDGSVYIHSFDGSVSC
jgi:hypothetical protein